MAGTLYALSHLIFSTDITNQEAMVRLNNLSDVTQLRSDSGGIWTGLDESVACTIILLLMTNTFKELGFSIEYPTPCVLIDQEPEAG